MPGLVVILYENNPDCRQITFTQAQKLVPDSEWLEHFCTDNEMSAQHFR